MTEIDESEIDNSGVGGMKPHKHAIELTKIRSAIAAYSNIMMSLADAEKFSDEEIESNSLLKNVLERTSVGCRLKIVYRIIEDIIYDLEFYKEAVQNNHVRIRGEWFER